MEKLVVLSLICGILQIVGFLCICIKILCVFVLKYNVNSNYRSAINVLIGISGFAAIVKYFILPSDLLLIAAGIAGFGLIIFSLIPSKAQGYWAFFIIENPQNIHIFPVNISTQIQKIKKDILIVKKKT